MPPYYNTLLRENHRPPTDHERAAAVFAKAARKERRRTAFIFIRRRMQRFLSRAVGFASKLRFGWRTRTARISRDIPRYHPSEHSCKNLRNSV